MATQWQRSIIPPGQNFRGFQQMEHDEFMRMAADIAQQELSQMPQRSFYSPDQVRQQLSIAEAEMQAGRTEEGMARAMAVRNAHQGPYSNPQTRDLFMQFANAAIPYIGDNELSRQFANNFVMPAGSGTARGIQENLAYAELLAGLGYVEEALALADQVRPQGRYVTPEVRSAYQNFATTIAPYVDDPIGAGERYMFAPGGGMPTMQSYLSDFLASETLRNMTGGGLDAEGQMGWLPQFREFVAQLFARNPELWDSVW